MEILQVPKARKLAEAYPAGYSDSKARWVDQENPYNKPACQVK